MFLLLNNDDGVTAFLTVNDTQAHAVAVMLTAVDGSLVNLDTHDVATVIREGQVQADNDNGSPVASLYAWSLHQHVSGHVVNKHVVELQNLLGDFTVADLKGWLDSYMQDGVIVVSPVDEAVLS